MKYRLLFICLVSILFVSLTMNVIHSEALSATKESLRISDMVQNKVINDLHIRINELEN